MHNQSTTPLAKRYKEHVVVFAGVLSFVVGAAALVLKFWSFEITQSQVVLSDALESIVNVVAAGMALVVLRYAAQPPDVNHPYGHGKTEFFSAAFEGGLVAFAAVLILVQSFGALWTGHVVNHTADGIWILAAAGLLNLGLGYALHQIGKKHGSITLAASASHVLADVWTTGVALIGLFAVAVTGLDVLDPILGIAAGLYLAVVGLRIFRASLGGLLDEENRDVLTHLASAFNEVRRAGIIGVHGARIMRSGGYHYIDAHVIVPEFWDVKTSHDEVNRFERAAMARYLYAGEIHFHVDPCRRAFCQRCILSDCPIRQAPFEKEVTHTLAEIVGDTSSGSMLKVVE